MKLLLIAVCAALSLNIFAQANVKEYKNESGKWGFINKQSEKEIVPCTYDSISYSYDEIYYLWKNKLKGIAGADGQELVPCNYDKVYVRTPANFAEVTKNGKTGVIDFKGNFIVPMEYNKVIDFRTPGIVHFIVEKDNKQGLYNREGKEKLSPVYKDIHIYYEQDVDSSAYMILTKDGKKGLADVNGDLVFDTEYNDLLCYYEWGYTIAKREKWGVILNNGQITIPFAYDTIIAPYKSHIIYLFKGKINKLGKGSQRYDGKFSVADINGEITSKNKYDDIIYTHNEPPVQVESDGKIGMIGKDGTEMVTCKYDWVEPINKKIYKYFIGTRTRKQDTYEYDYNGKFGMIDIQGKEITSAEFSDIQGISYGYVLVKNFDGKKGIYNDSGKMIIPCTFDDIERYNVNFYTDPDDMGIDYWLVFKGKIESFKKQGKYGLYDKSGNVLTKVDYDNISPIYKGSYKVMNNDKWALLSEDGKLMTDYKYDEIDDNGFKNGRLMVFQGTKSYDEYENYVYDGFFGYIDKSGKEIIPLKFKEAHTFYNGQAEVMINDINFYIDVDGKEIK